MKVLIVFNHPAPYKVRVFNELAKHVDLEVIFERDSASDRPSSFYDCNVYNFKVTFFKKGYIGNEGTNTNELVSFLKHHYHDYDLVVMNGYSHLTEMKAIRYMYKNNLPFTLLINGGVIKKDLLIKKIIKSYFIKRAQYYLSPCEEADEYLMHYKAEKGKIFHYPYSNFYNKDIIKSPLTNEEKLKRRKELNLPEGKLFVSAAQFIARKNNLQLIKCFINQPSSLLLIGSGKEQKKYEEFIKANGIKNVKIMPFMKKNNLFEIMKICDGFITLSKQDIFGHTTLEAMACGLPVISSRNVVSSLHYIKNGYNGYCVDENNILEVQEAMKKIKEEMNQNSIATAQTSTYEKTAERYAEIFKDILK